MEEERAAFERSSLSEQVEAALRKEIVFGRMQPGQRISVNDFKGQWKISSTPFRDAVRALEMQGFVMVEPRKGVYVASLNSKAVDDIFDLRIALECMAVERATHLVPAEEAARVLKIYEQARKDATTGKLSSSSKTDRLVHDLARVHCGNKRLQKVLSSHLELIRWAQSTITRKQPETSGIALPEHISIMKAVCARDAEGASRAMRAHLENSRERLRSQITLKQSK